MANSLFFRRWYIHGDWIVRFLIGCWTNILAIGVLNLTGLYLGGGVLKRIGGGFMCVCVFKRIGG